MERRWNLTAFMGLALLFLASTAAAANTNPAVAEEQETASGMKFCVSSTEDNGSATIGLSQQPSSYEPMNYEEDNGYPIYHNEYCFEQWYDGTGNDAYTELAARLSEDAYPRAYNFILESDIDFGGVSSDSSACNMNFKPLPKLSSEVFLEGYGYTIKNLCLILPSVSSDYIADYVDYQNEDYDFGIGFFSEMEYTRVSGVNFENVYIKVKNGDPTQIVPTGVLAGRLIGSSEYSYPAKTVGDINLKNVKVVAAQAGGLVGLVSSNAPEFREITGENVEIFADTGTVAISMDESSFAEYSSNLAVHLGGVVGMVTSGITMVNVGITGLNVHSDVYDIELTPEGGSGGSSEYAELGQALGGLVGTLVASFNEDFEESVNIVNTYTVGNISIPASHAGSGEAMLGFLVGALSIDTDVSYTIANNYHYGEDDFLAADLAGLLYLDGTDWEAADWIQVSFGGRNYRNSIDGMILFNAAEFDSTNYKWSEANGGAVPADLMQKDAFALALTANTYEAPGGNAERSLANRFSASAWSRKADWNEGCPVLVSEEFRPFYKITFKAGQSSIGSNELSVWRSAGAVTYGDSVELSIYTDYSGKLGNSDWQKHAAELAAGDYYWSGNESGSGIYKVKSTTTFDGDRTLYLMNKKTVPLHYGFIVSEDTGSRFVPVSEYLEGRGDYYFLGVPAETVSSADLWNDFPELVTVSTTADGPVYAYLSYTIMRRSCSVQEGQTGGDDVQVCAYEGLYVGNEPYYASEVFYAGNVQSGEDIYIVYGQQPISFAKADLYVGDFQLGGNDREPATIQVMALDMNGETVLTEGSFDLPTSETGELVDVIENSEIIPFSPYLKVNYSGDMWNNVSGVVAFVVVGGPLGSSDSKGAIEESIDELIRRDSLDHPLLRDTVTALESADEIFSDIMKVKETYYSFVYARYVRLGTDGTLNLENLYSALAPLRQDQGDYSVFVGFMPEYTEITYRVSFDVNLVDTQNLFVTDEGLSGESLPMKDFTTSTETEMLVERDEWYLYRTDACFTGGWYVTPDMELDSTAYEKMIFSIWDLENDSVKTKLPTLVEEEEDGALALKLYAVWDWSNQMCDNMNRVVSYKTVEGYGEVRLQQVWKGDTLVHLPTNINEGEFAGSYGFEVPWAEQNFTLTVVAAPDPGYELDGSITFNYLAYDEEKQTEVEKSVRVRNGATISITPEMYDNMELSASFVIKSYKLVFETGMDSVFYGETPVTKDTYKLKNEDDSIDFPMLVYTSDQCIEGWTARPEFEQEMMEECEGDSACEEEMSESDRWWVFKKFNFELSEMLIWDNAEMEEYPVYAKWTNAKTCVEDLGYGQASLEAENGSIAFEELMEDDSGETLVQLHRFAEDNTMLLPSGLENSIFVVRGQPEKGYVLDSLVMTLDEETFVYHEGDTLSGDISQAKFQAFFRVDNSTPVEFVTTKLLQSGNAVRLEFTTTEFFAGDAKIRITLENDKGTNVVDTVIAIQETPYTGSWEYYPLYAGSYLVTAVLSNDRDSALYEQDFEIKSEVALIADGWRMLALSKMDVDSALLADDDVRAYWWDDAKDYGAYWRYQRLTNEADIKDLTGYWFSSLEGRPLQPKKNVKQPKGPVAWSMDSVYTGWNMVANPYGWYVDLYGAEQSERSDIEFWGWNDSLGAYEEVSVVGPYEAVWAKVNSKKATWKLPENPAFVATVGEDGNDSLTNPLKKTVELAYKGKDNWTIRAVLSDAKGKRDSWNFLGVSESGWTSEEPPAGMGDHVNLSIKDGKRSLAKSFKKAAGDSYEWTISLDASGDRMGYLHFEGLDALRATGLKVFVTVDGTTTQMSERDTLKVAIGSLAKTATVRVAPSARTIVAQKLNGLRAFQAGNSLQVGFQVSESLAGATAYVEILDMKGKVLSSASGTAVSGANTMTLQAPKSGLYMVRVRVGGKQAAGSVAVK